MVTVLDNRDEKGCLVSGTCGTLAGKEALIPSEHELILETVMTMVASQFERRQKVCVLDILFMKIHSQLRISNFFIYIIYSQIFSIEMMFLSSFLFMFVCYGVEHWISTKRITKKGKLQLHKKEIDKEGSYDWTGS